MLCMIQYSQQKPNSRSVSSNQVPQRHWAPRLVRLSVHLLTIIAHLEAVSVSTVSKSVDQELWYVLENFGRKKYFVGFWKERRGWGIWVIWRAANYKLWILEVKNLTKYVIWLLIVPPISCVVVNGRKFAPEQLIRLFSLKLCQFSDFVADLPKVIDLTISYTTELISRWIFNDYSTSACIRFGVRICLRAILACASGAVPTIRV